jgi:hypothetical protein
MKNLFLFSLLVATLFSCKKECAEDGTGTVKFINDGSTTVTIRLTEGLFNPSTFTIQPGQSRTVIAQGERIDIVSGTVLTGYDAIGQQTFEGGPTTTTPPFYVAECKSATVRITE